MALAGQGFLKNIHAYLRRHLHGDINLTRTFWLNGIAAGAVLVMAALVTSRASQGLDDVPRLLTGLARDAVVTLAAALSVIGVWNAASRAGAGERRLAPAGAKLAVLVVAIGGLHYLVTTVPGRIAIVAARLDPALAEYVIARTGTEEVTFSGALNDVAVRELAAELSRPGVKVLRITSHGGLIIPVMSLADIIAKRKIAVAALTRCLSSCTLLLAATPNAIATPGTRIAFHHPAPAVIGNSTDRSALALATAAWYARFREYGVAPRAVAEMARHPIWEPGFAQLADMGMLKYLLDGNPPRLVAANRWCRDHAVACAPPKPATR